MSSSSKLSASQLSAEVIRRLVRETPSDWRKCLAAAHACTAAGVSDLPYQQVVSMLRQSPPEVRQATWAHSLDLLRRLHSSSQFQSHAKPESVGNRRHVLTYSVAEVCRVLRERCEEILQQSPSHEQAVLLASLADVVMTLRAWSKSDHIPLESQFASAVLIPVLEASVALSKAQPSRYCGEFTVGALEAALHMERIEVVIASSRLPVTPKAEVSAPTASTDAAPQITTAVVDSTIVAMSREVYTKIVASKQHALDDTELMPLITSLTCAVRESQEPFPVILQSLLSGGGSHMVTLPEVRHALFSNVVASIQTSASPASPTSAASTTTSQLWGAALSLVATPSASSPTVNHLACHHFTPSSVDAAASRFYVSFVSEVMAASFIVGDVLLQRVRGGSRETLEHQRREAQRCLVDLVAVAESWMDAQLLSNGVMDRNGPPHGDNDGKKVAPILLAQFDAAVSQELFASTSTDGATTNVRHRLTPFVTAIPRGFCEQHAELFTRRSTKLLARWVALAKATNEAAQLGGDDDSNATAAQLATLASFRDFCARIAAVVESFIRGFPASAASSVLLQFASHALSSAEELHVFMGEQAVSEKDDVGAESAIHSPTEAVATAASPSRRRRSAPKSHGTNATAGSQKRKLVAEEPQWCEGALEILVLRGTIHGGENGNISGERRVLSLSHKAGSLSRLTSLLLNLSASEAVRVALWKHSQLGAVLVARCDAMPSIMEHTLKSCLRLLSPDQRRLLVDSALAMEEGCVSENLAKARNRALYAIILEPHLASHGFLENVTELPPDACIALHRVVEHATTVRSKPFDQSMAVEILRMGLPLFAKEVIQLQLSGAASGCGSVTPAAHRIVEALVAQGTPTGPSMRSQALIVLDHLNPTVLQLQATARATTSNRTQLVVKLLENPRNRQQHHMVEAGHSPKVSISEPRRKELEAQLGLMRNRRDWAGAVDVYQTHGEDLIRNGCGYTFAFAAAKHVPFAERIALDMATSGATCSRVGLAVLHAAVNMHQAPREHYQFLQSGARNDELMVDGQVDTSTKLLLVRRRAVRLCELALKLLPRPLSTELVQNVTSSLMTLFSNQENTVTQFLQQHDILLTTEQRTTAISGLHRSLRIATDAGDTRSVIGSYHAFRRCYPGVKPSDDCIWMVFRAVLNDEQATRCFRQADKDSMSVVSLAGCRLAAAYLDTASDLHVVHIVHDMIAWRVLENDDGFPRLCEQLLHFISLKIHELPSMDPIFQQQTSSDIVGTVRLWRNVTDVCSYCGTKWVNAARWARDTLEAIFVIHILCGRNATRMGASAISDIHDECRIVASTVLTLVDPNSTSGNTNLAFRRHGEVDEVLIALAARSDAANEDGSTVTIDSRECARQIEWLKSHRSWITLVTSSPATNLSQREDIEKALEALLLRQDDDVVCVATSAAALLRSWEVIAPLALASSRSHPSADATYSAAPAVSNESVALDASRNLMLVTEALSALMKSVTSALQRDGTTAGTFAACWLRAWMPFVCRMASRLWQQKSSLSAAASTALRIDTIQPWDAGVLNEVLTVLRDVQWNLTNIFRESAVVCKKAAAVDDLDQWLAREPHAVTLSVETQECLHWCIFIAKSRFRNPSQWNLARRGLMSAQQALRHIEERLAVISTNHASSSDSSTVILRWTQLHKMVERRRSAEGTQTREDSLESVTRFLDTLEILCNQSLSCKSNIVDVPDLIRHCVMLVTVAMPESDSEPLSSRDWERVLTLLTSFVTQRRAAIDPALHGSESDTLLEALRFQIRNVLTFLLSSMDQCKWMIPVSSTTDPAVDFLEVACALVGDETQLNIVAHAMGTGINDGVEESCAGLGLLRRYLPDVKPCSEDNVLTSLALQLVVDHGPQISRQLLHSSDHAVGQKLLDLLRTLASRFMQRWDICLHLIAMVPPFADHGKLLVSLLQCGLTNFMGWPPTLALRLAMMVDRQQQTMKQTDAEGGATNSDGEAMLMMVSQGEMASHSLRVAKQLSYSLNLATKAVKIKFNVGEGAEAIDGAPMQAILPVSDVADKLFASQSAVDAVDTDGCLQQWLLPRDDTVDYCPSSGRTVGVWTCAIDSAVLRLVKERGITVQTAALCSPNLLRHALSRRHHMLFAIVGPQPTNQHTPQGLALLSHQLVAALEAGGAEVEQRLVALKPLSYRSLFHTAIAAILLQKIADCKMTIAPASARGKDASDVDMVMFANKQESLRRLSDMLRLPYGPAVQQRVTAHSSAAVESRTTTVVTPPIITFGINDIQSLTELKVSSVMADLMRALSEQVAAQCPSGLPQQRYTVISTSVLSWLKAAFVSILSSSEWREVATRDLSVEARTAQAFTVVTSWKPLYAFCDGIDAVCGDPNGTNGVWSRLLLLSVVLSGSAADIPAVEWLMVECLSYLPHCTLVDVCEDIRIVCSEAPPHTEAVSAKLISKLYRWTSEEKRAELVRRGTKIPDAAAHMNHRIRAEVETHLQRLKAEANAPHGTSPQVLSFLVVDLIIPALNAIVGPLHGLVCLSEPRDLVTSMWNEVYASVAKIVFTTTKKGSSGANRQHEFIMEHYRSVMQHITAFTCGHPSPGSSKTSTQKEEGAEEARLSPALASPLSSWPLPRFALHGATLDQHLRMVTLQTRLTDEVLHVKGVLYVLQSEQALAASHPYKACRTAADVTTLLAFFVRSLLRARDTVRVEGWCKSRDVAVNLVFTAVLDYVKLVDEHFSSVNLASSDQLLRLLQEAFGPSSLLLLSVIQAPLVNQRSGSDPIWLRLSSTTIATAFQRANDDATHSPPRLLYPATLLYFFGGRWRQATSPVGSVAPMRAAIEKYEALLVQEIGRTKGVAAKHMPRLNPVNFANDCVGIVLEEMHPSSTTTSISVTSRLRTPLITPDVPSMVRAMRLLYELRQWCAGLKLLSSIIRIVDSELVSSDLVAASLQLALGVLSSPDQHSDTLANGLALLTVWHFLTTFQSVALSPDAQLSCIRIAEALEGLYRTTAAQQLASHVDAALVYMEYNTVASPLSNRIVRSLLPYLWTRIVGSLATSTRLAASDVLQNATKSQLALVALKAREAFGETVKHPQPTDSPLLQLLMVVAGLQDASAEGCDVSKKDTAVGVLRCAEHVSWRRAVNILAAGIPTLPTNSPPTSSSWTTLFAATMRSAVRAENETNAALGTPARAMWVRGRWHFMSFGRILIQSPSSSASPGNAVALLKFLISARAANQWQLALPLGAALSAAQNASSASGGSTATRELRRLSLLYLSKYCSAVEHRIPIELLTRFIEWSSEGQTEGGRTHLDADEAGMQITLLRAVARHRASSWIDAMQLWAKIGHPLKVDGVQKMALPIKLAVTILRRLHLENEPEKVLLVAEACGIQPIASKDLTTIITEAALRVTPQRVDDVLHTLNGRLSDATVASLVRTQCDFRFAESVRNVREAMLRGAWMSALQHIAEYPVVVESCQFQDCIHALHSKRKGIVALHVLVALHNSCVAQSQTAAAVGSARRAQDVCTSIHRTADLLQALMATYVDVSRSLSGGGARFSVIGAHFIHACFTTQPSAMAADPEAFWNAVSQTVGELCHCAHHVPPEGTKVLADLMDQVEKCCEEVIAFRSVDHLVHRHAPHPALIWLQQPAAAIVLSKIALGFRPRLASRICDAVAIACSSSSLTIRNSMATLQAMSVFGSSLVRHRAAMEKANPVAVRDVTVFAPQATHRWIEALAAVSASEAVIHSSMPTNGPSAQLQHLRMSLTTARRVLHLASQSGSVSNIAEATVSYLARCCDSQVMVFLLPDVFRTCMACANSECSADGDAIRRLAISWLQRLCECRDAVAVSADVACSIFDGIVFQQDGSNSDYSSTNALTRLGPQVRSLVSQVVQHALLSAPSSASSSAGGGNGSAVLIPQATRANMAAHALRTLAVLDAQGGSRSGEVDMVEWAVGTLGADALIPSAASVLTTDGTRMQMGALLKAIVTRHSETTDSVEQRRELIELFQKRILRAQAVHKDALTAELLNMLQEACIKIAGPEWRDVYQSATTGIALSHDPLPTIVTATPPHGEANQDDALLSRMEAARTFEACWAALQQVPPTESVKLAIYEVALQRLKSTVAEGTPDDLASLSNVTLDIHVDMVSRGVVPTTSCIETILSIFAAIASRLAGGQQEVTSSLIDAAEYLRGLELFFGTVAVIQAHSDVTTVTRRHASAFEIKASTLHHVEVLALLMIEKLRANGEQLVAVQECVAAFIPCVVSSERSTRAMRSSTFAALLELLIERPQGSNGGDVSPKVLSAIQGLLSIITKKPPLEALLEGFMSPSAAAEALQSVLLRAAATVAEVTVLPLATSSPTSTAPTTVEAAVNAVPQLITQLLEVFAEACPNLHLQLAATVALMVAPVPQNPTGDGATGSPMALRVFKHLLAETSTVESRSAMINIPVAIQSSHPSHSQQWREAMTAFGKIIEQPAHLRITALHRTVDVLIQSGKWNMALQCGGNQSSIDGACDDYTVAAVVSYLARHGNVKMARDVVETYRGRHNQHGPLTAAVAHRLTAPIAAESLPM